MAKELSGVRKRLVSLAEDAKDAQPEEVVNMSATVVGRIYITTENDKRVCHIFVKGCTTEDYTDLFGGTTDYISIEKNPLNFNMCDSDKCREHHMVFTPVTGVCRVLYLIFHLRKTFLLSRDAFANPSRL